MNKVSAVIVIYFPEIEQLNKLIVTLSMQVKTIIIVDNSDDGKSLSFDDLKLNLHYINLGENQGIAKAQNIGFKKAKDLGSSDIILFDQDSMPSVSFVTDLTAAREAAINDGIQVAAVGPSHIDIDSNEPSSFVLTDSKKVTLFKPDLSSSYMVCDFLIASGCMLEVSTFEMVGLMEEELFIDCVDIEWGFRAKSIGLTCLCAPQAKMHHKIGDKPLVMFGYPITTHAPIRHYYYYRNFYLLLKRDYVPLAWKKYVFFKSAVQACIFCLFLPQRIQHFKAIVKGIYHGIKGRSGRL